MQESLAIDNNWLPTKSPLEMTISLAHLMFCTQFNQKEEVGNTVLQPNQYLMIALRINPNFDQTAFSTMSFRSLTTITGIDQFSVYSECQIKLQ